MRMVRALIRRVRYANYIQITSDAVGAVPHINKLTANNSETDIEVVANSEVTMQYEGKKADGSGSRGIKTLEKPVGVKVSELGFNSTSKNNMAWSLAFWVKFNGFTGGTQIVDMRDPGTGWPQNNWGTMWTTYDPNTGVYEVTLREKNAGGAKEYKQRWEVDFVPGAWTHFVLAMEGNGTTTKPMVISMVRLLRLIIGSMMVRVVMVLTLMALLTMLGGIIMSSVSVLVVPEQLLLMVLLTMLSSSTRRSQQQRLLTQ